MREGFEPSSISSFVMIVVLKGSPNRNRTCNLCNSVLPGDKVRQAWHRSIHFELFGNAHRFMAHIVCWSMNTVQHSFMLDIILLFPDDADLTGD